MAEFDYSEAISEARAKYESISKALDVDRLTAEAKDLEVKAAEPGLWDDPENAQKVTSKLSAVQSQLKRLASADQRIEDVETLVELGQEEEDADTLAEAKAEVESIQKDLDDMEIQTLLDGEYDERSAVVTIRSAPAAWMRPISRRCCCACTCVGRNATDTRPRSWTPPTRKKPASSRPRSRWTPRTHTGD